MFAVLHGRCSIVANRGPIYRPCCAYGVFAALDRGRGRLARGFLLRCVSGCDSGQLDHDWGNGFDIFDDAHFDDGLEDAS